jgi:hypothetical protein
LPFAVDGVPLAVTANCKPQTANGKQPTANPSHAN